MSSLQGRHPEVLLTNPGIANKNKERYRLEGLGWDRCWGGFYRAAALGARKFARSPRLPQQCWPFFERGPQNVPLPNAGLQSLGSVWAMIFYLPKSKPETGCLFRGFLGPQHPVVSLVFCCLELPAQTVSQQRRAYKSEASEGAVGA